MHFCLEICDSLTTCSCADPGCCHLYVTKTCTGQCGPAAFKPSTGMLAAGSAGFCENLIAERRLECAFGMVLIVEWSILLQQWVLAILSIILSMWCSVYFHRGVPDAVLCGPFGPQRQSSVLMMSNVVRMMTLIGFVMSAIIQSSRGLSLSIGAVIGYHD